MVGPPGFTTPALIVPYWAMDCACSVNQAPLHPKNSSDTSEQDSMITTVLPAPPIRRPQARQAGQTRRDMKRKNSTTIPSTIKPAIFLNTFLAIIILGSFSPLVQFIQEIPSNSPPKIVSSVDLKARAPVHLSPPRALHPTTKKKIPANRNAQPARLVTLLQVMRGSGSIAAVPSTFSRGIKCPLGSRLPKRLRS